MCPLAPPELEPSALIDQLGLADAVVDEDTRQRAIARFRDQGIVLPTFAELADPSRIDRARTAGVDKDAPDARNLFRVHWYCDLAGDPVAVPDHVVLPPSLTGVESPIIVVFGDRFPMITAHKVLAAYACLAPRVDHRAARPQPPPRRSGRPRATTRGAASPSAGSWAVGGWPCCRRACRRSASTGWIAGWPTRPT